MVGSFQGSILKKKFDKNNIQIIDGLGKKLEVVVNLLVLER